MSSVRIPCIPVAEVRDYRRVNAELSRLLQMGHPRVSLIGVSRQRLLLTEIAGPWEARVDVIGDVGPEFGAGLAAPQLLVAVHGDASDGVARGMKAGSILILGDAGELAGSEMQGGVLVVRGQSGHRAGLRQTGGLIVLDERTGRLCGERQTGGAIWIRSGRHGPFVGHGQRGGTRTTLAQFPDDADPDWIPTWSKLDTIERVGNT